MAATYSGDPANSTSDAVRFLIGDTEVTEALVQDEEIAWAIAQTANAHLAAAQVAKAIAAKLARSADTDLVSGALRAALSRRAETFLKLADKLTQEATGGAAGELPEVYAGGLSKSEKTSDKADSDLVQPSFERGMHDSPANLDPKTLRADV
jgi:hypothetical protein